MYINIVKATYDKPIANTMLNEEKLKSISLKSGMRQVPTIPTPIQHNHGIPSHSNYAKRRNERNTNR
jgi:hypothetical protein